MIDISQIRLSFLGHCLKNNVSGGMTESIVDPFKMIQIEYADGKRMDSTIHEGFLMFQNFVHLAPVEDLRQVVL